MNHTIVAGCTDEIADHADIGIEELRVARRASIALQRGGLHWIILLSRAGRGCILCNKGRRNRCPLRMNGCQNDVRAEFRGSRARLTYGREFSSQERKLLSQQLHL